MAPLPENDPPDRDERLGEAVEAYLGLAEAGQAPDPAAFAAGYPELADDLLAALDGLAMVRGLVGDPTGPGRSLESGRHVAGYRIVRELGRGGMGIVYEAVHVDLDRPVALKVLGLHAAPDSSGRRRFLNEAKTAAGLHHTHIVPVFDVGQVGGLCYYAMQRIEGSGLDRVLRALRRDRATAAGSASGSVRPTSPAATASVTVTWDRDRLDADPPITVTVTRDRDDDRPPFLPPKGSGYYRWVARLGRQAAEALAHAHRSGVIHRDVKPSNLLVDARGTVWVADFGLARRLADPGQTHSDSLIGTPRYMSPEQAELGPVDHRSDIYSLGATLYEMLTLRPLFDGETSAEVVQQVIAGGPVPPRRCDPRIPRDLETIVLKCLDRRPADRYASAAELAEDLGRFLGHEPVRARRIGPLGRLWRFARRHPSLTGVSATAAAVVLTTATVAYVRILQERDDALRARAAAQSAMHATAVANRKAQDALRARMRDQLWHQAAMLRGTTVPNRREHGLELLRQAVELGPGPEMRTTLRDEATRLLVLRDVGPLGRAPAAAKVQGLTYAAEGTRLALLADDGATFSLWDLATHRRLAAQPIPPDPDEPRTRPVFGGLSRIAAVGSDVLVVPRDGRGLLRFDATTGAPGARLELETAGREVLGLVSGPDARLLVTIVRARTARPGNELTLLLWDAGRPDAPIATLDLPRPRSGEEPGRPLAPVVAIAPDGRTIAAARPRDSVIRLWSADGQPRGTIDAQVPLTALALGPEGLLAVAGEGAIRLWQVESGAGPAPPAATPLTGLSPHQGFLHLLRFSPDGTMLADAGPGAGIELWDLATHELVAALPTAGWINDLAFAAGSDGLQLAAAGPTTPPTLWGVAEPVVRVHLPEFKGVPRSLAFGPEGLLAMASSAGELRLWRPGRCPTPIHDVSPARPTAVAFDDRGHLLALETGALRRFALPDLSTDACRGAALVALEPLPLPRGPEPGPRNKGAAPPNGPAAFARSADGRVLALARRSEILLLRPSEPDPPRRLSLPNGESPGPRGDAGPGPGPGPGSRPPGWRELALNPAADRLYLISRADEFTAWSLANPGPSRLNWTAPATATVMALSPDGTVLALGDRTGHVTLIDTASGATSGPLVPPAGEEGDRVSSLAFSPDGAELAVGTREQIRLWALTGPPAPRVVLPGHRGAIAAVAYDPTGHYLAAAGEDKLVEVWDLDLLHRELDALNLGW